MDWLVALVPSLGVGLLFFAAIRAMVRADRDERAAAVGLETEERRSLEAKGDAPDTPTKF